MGPLWRMLVAETEIECHTSYTYTYAYPGLGILLRPLEIAPRLDVLLNVYSNSPMKKLLAFFRACFLIK